MKCSGKTLLHLVGGIYDAASDSARWAPFLEKLGNVLKTPQAALHLHDLVHKHRSVVAEIGFDPAFTSSYREYYGARNAFLIHGKKHLWPGNVCSNEVLCPDSVLFTTEFYSDWLAPQGSHRAIDAIIQEQETLKTILVLIRGCGARPFDEDELSLVRMLMPHLQRAVQFHLRTSDLLRFRQSAKLALDQWALGVIALSHDGRSLSMNRAAEAFLRAGDGLIFTKGGLSATSRSDAVKLNYLIREAIATASRQSTHSGGCILLERAHGKRPLTVLVTPVSSNQTFFDETSVACMLFIGDPDAIPESDGAILKQLYRLTPAESKVAALLICGHDAKGISEELRISTNTVRTHIRVIREKTNTRRQADLIRLLLNTPVNRCVLDR